MSDVFQAGVNVTLIGLGVAFVLLTVLIVAVHAMSAVARLIEAERPQLAAAAAAAAPATATARPPRPEPRSVEPHIAGAAAAAVRMYRTRRRT